MRMHRQIIFGAMLFALLCTCAGVKAETSSSNQIVLDFSKGEEGKPPPDFFTALTGEGGSVSWVVKDKALAQVSTDQTDYRFPLCIYDKLIAKDVDVSVRFKAVAGEVDRAAGLVVRLKDKDNYYITRANALEDNVRLYKVVKGSRKQFAGANTKVSSNEWHSLKLSVKGIHFQVSFDDKMLFEANDKTFQEAGKVGLWTKADSLTYFDDFRITNNDAR